MKLSDKVEEMLRFDLDNERETIIAQEQEPFAGSGRRAGHRYAEDRGLASHFVRKRGAEWTKLRIRDWQEYCFGGRSVALLSSRSPAVKSHRSRGKSV